MEYNIICPSIGIKYKQTLCSWWGIGDVSKQNQEINPMLVVEVELWNMWNKVAKNMNHNQVFDVSTTLL